MCHLRDSTQATSEEEITGERIKRRSEFNLQDADKSPFYTEGAIPFFRDPETPTTFGFNFPDNRKFKDYKALSRKYALDVESGVSPLTENSTEKLLKKTLRKHVKKKTLKL